MIPGSIESIVARLQGGIQTIDPVSIDVSNAIFVVALLFGLNWGFLLRASGELRRTSLRFMQMNLVLALGVLTMLRFPSIVQVAGKNEALGFIAYLPIVPDFLAIYGLVLARHGKQILRGTPSTWVQHYAMLMLVAGVEFGLIYTRHASLFIFIIFYSILVAYVCLMTLKEVIGDKKSDLFQKSVEGFPFFLVALIMLLRVITLDRAPAATDAIQDTAYITWGYFVALVLVNITLISQVTRFHIERIVSLAAIDNLTGAWLRKKIAEKIRDEKMRFERHRDNFSIVLFDLVHFKHINDAFGHACGDAALQHTVRLATENLRKLDSLGRWGGEEFLIVLPNSDIHEAVQVAEKLRKKLDTCPLIWHDQTIHITASFGVAQCPPNVPFETMVDKADRAMYEAKQSGRNRVHQAAEDAPDA